MMILGKKYGQLGNRLFLYAHLIAAAEEYGVELVNPSFAEYARLFPRTAHDRWCHYPASRIHQSQPPSPWSRKFLAKAVELSGRGLHGLGGSFRNLKVIRLRRGESMDLGSDEFASLVWSRHVLLQGWLFRSERLLEQHAEVVRSHFSIPEAVQATIDSRLKRLRDRVDVVVGIHIRHGDYATYLNGKYFYPTSEYANVMRQIKEQLSPARVGFLVCGNGILREQDFSGLTVSCERDGVIEDLYGFAGTDLLVGPPSTFTGWAAFYGKVPIHWLESTDKLPDVRTMLQDRSMLAA